MKRLFVPGFLLGSLLGLGACSDIDGLENQPIPSPLPTPLATPTPSPTAVPTLPPGSSALLLQQARQSSETDAPVPINDGAVAFDDTSETAAPIPVNR